MATLLEHDDPQKAADLLIAQANDAGGRDNVTVIVLDVLAGDDPPDPTQEIDFTPTWAEDTDISTEDIAQMEGADLAATDGNPNPDATVTGGRRLGRRDRRRTEKRAEQTASTALTGSPDEDADSTEPESTGGNSAADPPKKKRLLTRATVIFVLLAILVTAFVTTAAWARRGFYVEFNDNEQVVLYQGRPGGFLWIDPTVEATGAATRGELTDASVALVTATPTFSSLNDAMLFIRGLEMVEATDADPPTTADDGSS